MKKIISYELTLLTFKFTCMNSCFILLEIKIAELSNDAMMRHETLFGIKIYHKRMWGQKMDTNVLNNSNGFYQTYVCFVIFFLYREKDVY